DRLGDFAGVQSSRRRVADRAAGGDHLDERQLVLRRGRGRKREDKKDAEHQSGLICTLRNLIAPPGVFGWLPNCRAMGPFGDSTASVSAVLMPFTTTVIFGPRRL